MMLVGLSSEHREGHLDTRRCNYRLRTIRLVQTSADPIDVCITMPLNVNNDNKRNQRTTDLFCTLCL